MPLHTLHYTTQYIVYNMPMQQFFHCCIGIKSRQSFHRYSIERFLKERHGVCLLIYQKKRDEIVDFYRFKFLKKSWMTKHHGTPSPKRPEDVRIRCIPSRTHLANDAHNAQTPILP